MIAAVCAILCELLLADSVCQKLAELTTWKASTQSAKGTGWDVHQICELEALDQLDWWYNWGPNADSAAMHRSTELGIEFVPMQWGKWGIETLSKDIRPGAKHLLGFNEPGHQQQANLQPEEAAALWPAMQAVARDMGLKLGTPSPAPCGAQCVRASPFQWWDEFFAACRDCHFDFLATHLYSCNPKMLQYFLNECKKYHLPIWLTEFSCPAGPHGTVEQQQDFMTAAVRVIGSMPEVQRHAWFAPHTSGDWLGASASLLMPDKPALSALGKLYMQDTQSAIAQDATSDWGNIKPNLHWSDMCNHCLDLGHDSDVSFKLRATCQDCGFHTLDY